MPVSYHSHRLAEPFRICRPEKGAGPPVSVGQVAESSLSCTWVVMVLFSTYLSFREAKPSLQGSTRFYRQGLKLSCRYSFRGERERTCVRTKCQMMVRLHNIPLLRRKTHGVFTEEIQFVQRNLTTVNSKLTTVIRNLYSYKTYNYAVFAGFLPGFISVHGCFYFVAQDKDLLPKQQLLIFIHNGRRRTHIRDSRFYDNCFTAPFVQI